MTKSKSQVGIDWEYKQVTTLNTFDFMESLNKCGREGWEIITVLEVSAFNDSKEVKPELMAILKRRLLNLI